MASAPERPACASLDYTGGFDSLEAEVRIDRLPVEGELPDWLGGSLLRTGPARFEVGEKSFNHWFDGQAMLHRFGFGSGEVSYRSRFLRSKAHAATDRGEIAYSEFATDPCRTLFGRAVAMFNPKLSDNANVNLVELGDRFIAMTEAPIPIQFDGATLETAGVAYDVPGMLTTAHPHLDRASGGLLNYAVKLGPRNEYRFFLLPPDGDEPAVIASASVDRPAYMHSFGLTERHLVLVEFPLVVNPLKLAFSGRPYIENYVWEPERGTKISLFDRLSGEFAGSFETEAMFAFHHINAFERGNETVIDISAFPDASVIADLYLDRLRGGGGIPRAQVRRLTADRDAGTAANEVLLDDDIELARINYGRCNERPYRYLWGVGVGGSGWLERIVRGDLEHGSTTTWQEAGCYPGEPVFVARPDAEAEDDGVLLSVVFDADRGDSFLLVLDARTLEVLARARAPHHIPYGFHGQYSATT